MKYVVDVDSLINCLDYLDAIKVNGAVFNQTELVKEFIKTFPKTPVETEYYELKLGKEEPEYDYQGSEEEV